MACAHIVRGGCGKHEGDMELKADNVLLRTGLKSRYAYAAVFSKVQGKFSGIVKFDLIAKNGGAVVGQIEHGPDRYGGEAVFVNGSGPGESQSCLVSGSQCYLQVFLEDALHAQYHCLPYRIGCTPLYVASTLTVSAPMLRLKQHLSLVFR